MKWFGSSTRRRFFAAAVGASGVAMAQSSGEPVTIPTKVLKEIGDQLLAGTTSDPKHERVLIRYTRGHGAFSADRQFISLQMSMFTLDGRPDGYHEGVWQALFTSPPQLLAVPTQPTDPLTLPVGPVQSQAPLANTKAHWTFGDGSRVYAEGPALVHITPLTDGSSNFNVACSQVVTLGGTGFFQNAQGLKQSLGATAVPAGVNLFDLTQPTVPFTATTIDTFRIVWPDGVPAGFNLDVGW